MRLALSNISDVIAAYLDEELLPKGTPLQKWTTTFIGAAIAKQVQSFVESNKEKFEFISILDKDGIDIEGVRDLAIEAFTKSGPVEMSGIVFNKDDVPTIYNIAKKFCKE